MKKLVLFTALSFLLMIVIFRTPFLARFPVSECSAFQAWLQTQNLKHPAIKDVLPLPPDDENERNLQKVAADVFSWSQWPTSGIKFALFKKHTKEQVLASPSLQTGAFLIIVADSQTASPPPRREASAPWVTTDSEQISNLLPLTTLNTVTAPLLETALNGRRLHSFHLTLAPENTLPLCRSATGACAIWDGSTGTVILARQIVVQTTTSNSTTSNNNNLPLLLEMFSDKFFSLLSSRISLVQQRLVAENTTSSSIPATVEGEEEEQKLLDQTNKQECSNKNEIAVAVAEVATAAITFIFFQYQLPLWWCIACATVLGLLSPFIFNFGLTAAADALCASMKLPDDACSDLWWAAFALAMVVSLASAIPIVFVCRLPDCVKHIVGSYRGRGGGGGAAAAAVQ